MVEPVIRTLELDGNTVEIFESGASTAAHFTGVAPKDGAGVSALHHTGVRL